MLVCGSSCVSSFKFSNDEIDLPLVSTKLAIGEFAGVLNTTVIDVEYSQSTEVSAELICPEICKEYLDIKVDKEFLSISFVEGLDNDSRNELSRSLKHSKLLLSSKTLKNVMVNGSSTFQVNTDLRAESFDAVVNGSGDISLQGVHCSNNVYVGVNGSGDIDVLREIKAKSITIAVNGSGDVNCEMLTAYKVAGSVNGSGDLTTKNVIASKVIAMLSGSGDIKVEGKCDEAVISITGSGDITAKKLVAQDVVATVTSSGDLSCNAQETLTADVTGSGSIGYLGNPVVATKSKKDKVYAL